MNNLSKLLQKIKENPVEYLDKPSITCLNFFLMGYLSTRTEMGLDREGSGIEEFQEWVQKREKINGCHSWARIILFLNGSEKAAFYSFFQLFNRFLISEDSFQKDENAIGGNSSLNVDNLMYHPRELYGLLNDIKKRPSMYLGTSSITRLDMLLRGYSLAQREVGRPLNEHEREFEGFQSWIQKKYEIATGQSWSKIILFYSIDEEEALGKFFELFAEYLNRNKSVENVLIAD